MRSNSLENCCVASGDNFVTHDVGKITSGDTSVNLTQISQDFKCLTQISHLTKTKASHTDFTDYTDLKNFHVGQCSSEAI